MSTHDTYVRMGRSGAACRAVKIKPPKERGVPPEESLSPILSSSPPPPGAQWVLAYAPPTAPPILLPSPSGSTGSPALSVVSSSDGASTKSSATAGQVRFFRKRFFGGSKPSKAPRTTQKSSSFNSFAQAVEEPHPFAVVAPPDVLGREEEGLEDFMASEGYGYRGGAYQSKASYNDYAHPSFLNSPFVVSTPSSVERERHQLLSRLELFGEALLMHSTGSLSAPSASTSPDPSSSSRRRQSSATSSNDSAGRKTPPQVAQRYLPSHFRNASLHQNRGTSGPTLEDHPALVDLVRRCRKRFGARTAVVAIIRGDQVVFLAAEGVPFGLRGVPRVGSFCAHAITEIEEGLIVLDSQRDPRFTSGLIAPMMGAKFYAGVPLYASSRAPDPTLPKLAIGALCILDDAPRFEFSPSDCLQLLSLAAEATSQIERWVTDNQLASKAQAMSLESRYRDWQSSISISSTTTSASRAGSLQLDPRSSSATPTQASMRSSPLPVPSPPRSLSSPPRSTCFPPPRHPLPPIPSSPPSQPLLSSAVRSLFLSLDLSLAYLVSLDLSLPTPSPALIVLAAHPATPRSFDPSLHLKALRAPEGGLLYRKPAGGEREGYASGVLIPVIQRDGRGWVLCGFTEEVGREWREDELDVFVEVAERIGEEVEGVVLW